MSTGKALNWRILLPLASLFVGFSVRIFSLGRSSLWLDEIRSYDRAIIDSWPEIYQLLRVKNHAPLYDGFILRHWIKIGQDEFFLRFPAVIFGLLTIALTYSLARRIFGTRVALLSSLLVALSPLHILYSREVRMYTLAAFLVLLSLYFLVRATEPGSKRNWPYWLGYAISAALALYTHYYSSFGLIAIALFVLVWMLLKRQWRPLLSFLTAELLVAILFAPWLPTFWFQLNGNAVAWIPETTSQYLYDILSNFFMDQNVLGPRTAIFVIILVVIVIAGLLIFITTQNRRAGTYQDQLWFGLYLLIFAAVGPILIAIVVSILKPLIVDRYFLIVIPAASIILAVASISLYKVRLARPLLLLSLIGIFISSIGTVTYDWKRDWRAAAAYMHEFASPEEDIVFVPGHYLASFTHYYDGSHRQVLIPAGEENVGSMMDATNLGQRFWVISIIPEITDTSSKVMDYANEQYVLGHCQLFGERIRFVSICLFQQSES